MTDDIAPAHLTGVWDGAYVYPPFDEAVSFTATLLDVDGRLSGSIHEIDEITGFAPQALTATVDGRRSGEVVTFTKRYAPAPGYDRPVLYIGTVGDGGHEITGSWPVDDMTGRFMMIRPRAEGSQANRRAVERV